MPTWTEDEFVEDLDRELNTRGLPRAEFMVQFKDGDFLQVNLWNAGATDFTLHAEYPTGQRYSPKVVAEDIAQSYYDWLELEEPGGD